MLSHSVTCRLKLTGTVSSHQQSQVLLYVMKEKINLLSKAPCSRPCRSHPRVNIPALYTRSWFSKQAGTLLQQGLKNVLRKILLLQILTSLLQVPWLPAVHCCFSHHLLHCLPRRLGVIAKHPCT